MKLFICFLLISSSLFLTAQTNFSGGYRIKMASQHAFYAGTQNVVNSKLQARNFIYEFNLLAHGKLFNHGGGYFITAGFNKHNTVTVNARKSSDYYYVSVPVQATGNYNFGGAGMYYKINRYFIGNYFDGGLFADLGLRLTAQLNHVNVSYPSGYSEAYSGENTEISVYSLFNFNFIKYLSSDVKVGYTIPLNLVNLSPFISFQKSLINMVSDTGSFHSPRAGYIAFQFGISMTVLRPNLSNF